MDILLLKLQKDLLQLTQEYKQDKNISDETYDSFAESTIKELISNVDFSIDTSLQDCKCMARLWNNGKGEKQCTHSKKKGDYCDKHNRMLQNDGVLRFGDIRQDKPTYDLIKQKQGIIEPLHWIQSDPLDQLQTVLDHQSRKTLLTTPKLVLQ